MDNATAQERLKAALRNMEGSKDLNDSHIKAAVMEAYLCGLGTDKVERLMVILYGPSNS